jgi:hypothetical protein
MLDCGDARVHLHLHVLDQERLTRTLFQRETSFAAHKSRKTLDACGREVKRKTLIRRTIIKGLGRIL